jgi:hypothetical protein
MQQILSTIRSRVATRYAYTGGAEMYYQDYTDDDTGRMLIAVPDGSYAMTPVNGEGTRPVPPNDGRWQWAPPPPPPVPDPPATQLPQPVTAPAPAPAPEGSAS